VSRHIRPVTFEIAPPRIVWPGRPYKDAITSPDGRFFFPEDSEERDSGEAAIKYLIETIAAERLAAKEAKAKPASTPDDLLQGYQRRPGSP
jgi:hypothetical protein